MRKLNGKLNSAVEWLKPFVLGGLTVLVIFAAFWIKNNHRALTNAFMYPEAVAEIRVEKEFSIKK